MKRIALVATLLLAVAALAGVARPDGARAVDPPKTDGRTVTVTGNGATSAVPDRAQVSFGVETRAASAKAALAANAQEMQAVIDAIRRAGGRDLATQYVSLSPRNQQDGMADGYVATNSVVATVDVSRAGAAIDAAVAAGANQVWGPTMSVSDQAKLYRQALRAAVVDARARAEVLADAAGADLGEVVSISESSASPVPVFAKGAAADAVTPVIAGPQETTATVSVTFVLM